MTGVIPILWLDSSPLRGSGLESDNKEAADDREERGN
jgi:hypothetical protein